MANEIKIIQTMTGDIFQPVRLYYQMHRKSGVLVAFNKLHCMSFDEPGDRWIWLYDGEAKKLKFKQSYASLPPHRRPIVLGSFYSRDDSQMYLDLGSIERAVAAAEFFDKHIKRTVAELKYVAIYNKIIAEDEHPGACFDTLFASVNPADIDGSSEERLAMAIAALESGHAMDIINQRWPASSRQRFGSAKWILCRLVGPMPLLGPHAGRACPTGVGPQQRRRNSCCHDLRQMIIVKTLRRPPVKT